VGRHRPEDSPQHGSSPNGSLGRAAPRLRRGGWRGKFAAAFRGVGRAIRGELSFRVHLPAAAMAIGAGVYFRVEPAEWAALVLAIGGVLVTEILNSAIEQLARGPGSRRHPRLRDSLDMAAGAVLVASIAAVATGLAIFLPRIMG
jgi:diacylglycerol kinase